MLTCVSVNVFALQPSPDNIKKDSPLFIPKCEDANFQYKTCIDASGKEITNPKFVEYGKNNPDRRGIRKSPNITVE